MKLEDLERASEVIQISTLCGQPLEEAFKLLPHGPELYPTIRRLLDDKQFLVLLDLKRAEQHALSALERLTPDTEYLRDELEEHLCRLQTLLGKVEQEECLRLDREVLLSVDPAEGLGEHTGGTT